MNTLTPPVPVLPHVATVTPDWRAALLAAVVGAAGGFATAGWAHLAPGTASLIGAAFGLCSALALPRSATSAGAGLISGLGNGFLLWIVLLAFAAVFPAKGQSASGVLDEMRQRIPLLLACVLGLGAPVGVTLGIRGSLRPGAAAFHWTRALVAGGFSGIVAALIFSRWMYAGDFFPLISGYGTLSTHFRSVLLHFAVACFIGGSFGGLFQDDVRNLGSSMGWGMAYAMFWWMLGSLTFFPLAAGQPVDWSAERAGDLFGPLVGHIFYGIILGIVYSAVNSVWTRLFVDADPLNRKREGPGIRLIFSVGWGSAAGFCGGLVALPFMIQTEVITKQAGLESGLPLALGILLHLGVSTLIGTSYGVLFRGETLEHIFGSLWGFMVGLLAWYAGPLTLLPLLLTGECDWRPAAAAALLPSLVAHLLFGVITANIFLAFERRAKRLRAPEPRPGTTPDSDSASSTRPAAALCAFALGVGILLPILLA